MLDKCTTIMEHDLSQISDLLLLNGTLTECPGLVHGKMGIAIFFFHYANFTKNDIYADYAMDVISEILNQIHKNTPSDYERGLAGIAVGINYLIQNKFLIIDEDVCEDFDLRMKLEVMYDLSSNFSLYNGLVGYGYYWISRLNYHEPSIQAHKCLVHIIAQIEESISNISIIEQTDVYCFINDLSRISCFEYCSSLLERCQNEWKIRSLDIVDTFPRLSDSTFGTIIRSYQHIRYFKNTLQDEFNAMSEQISDLNIAENDIGTGLLKGYAGEGMLRLTLLDQNIISWMHLL